MSRFLKNARAVNFPHIVFIMCNCCMRRKKRHMNWYWSLLNDSLIIQKKFAEYSWRTNWTSLCRGFSVMSDNIVGLEIFLINLMFKRIFLLIGCWRLSLYISLIYVVIKYVLLRLINFNVRYLWNENLSGNA